MGSPKVIIGRLINDKITFKPVLISKETEWVKWLDSEELVEFTTQLLKLVERIAKGRKTANDLELFLSEWRETALINQENDVLNDIIEAESELNAECY
jgi:hypothetical protein